MVHVCINGPCTHTYWPGFFGFHEKLCTFYMKSGTFSWKTLASTWKATKTADSIQISDFDLVFHRVQREGQLGISYILVVFGGACVCMCIWCMNAHILTWFCIVYIKSGTPFNDHLVLMLSLCTTIEKHFKTTKTAEFYHFIPLILTWSFRDHTEGRPN